jgi:hypothetical protein
MMHKLRTFELDTPPPPPSPCPFCGKIPYWMGFIVDNWGHQIVPRFCHPGVAADGECVLSGMCFDTVELKVWEHRVERPGG